MHTNTSASAPSPYVPRPLPSVNATPASVHAISSTDGLEVVAVFCPNCQLQRRTGDPQLSMTTQHINAYQRSVQQ